MFLTWSSEGRSISGTDTGEGQLTALVALGTIALVHVGFRPAWIGAAFIVATLARQLREFGADAGAALWLGVVAALVATALLVWDMFAKVRRDASGEA